MSWSIKATRPSCDVCGQFVSIGDVLAGRATHRMIEPDSDISMESWETLCRLHFHEEWDVAK